MFNELERKVERIKPHHRRSDQGDLETHSRMAGLTESEDGRTEAGASPFLRSPEL